jgi:hypothetical protein
VASALKEASWITHKRESLTVDAAQPVRPAFDLNEPLGRRAPGARHDGSRGIRGQSAETFLSVAVGAQIFLHASFFKRAVGVCGGGYWEGLHGIHLPHD